MSFKCGIIGLPNVGKSTLFNAITNTVNAEVANYPFCTIEPNINRISVPDDRLDQLAKIAGSQKIIPCYIDIADIAGLVAGASQGEGLGSKFLSHIREVDAIIHVVRCFDDSNILHVNNKIDPIKDLNIVETELIIADLEYLTKTVQTLENKKSKEKSINTIIEVGKKAISYLEKEVMITNGDFAEEETLILKNHFRLLTQKSILYVANIDENSINIGNVYTEQLTKYLTDTKKGSLLTISSKIEAELAVLSEQEKLLFLDSIGCKESGLQRLVKAGYRLLDLITFFTVGPKECHAWSIKNGAVAPVAAGCIHSDIQENFIRANTISFDDYIKYNGEEGCKNNGKMRTEGKGYVVQDGDIFHFLHS